MSNANIMANVYYKLIKSGLRTIDQVPENLKAEVQALLEADETSEPKE